jgi:GAF domain-containing protein
MYAPLLWQNEALGAVCVDHGEIVSTFTTDDLQLLLAVAHYAAMAVAYNHLQEDLRRESGMRANLLRQFSPQVAERLVRHLFEPPGSKHLIRENGSCNAERMPFGGVSVYSRR